MFKTLIKKDLFSEPRELIIDSEFLEYENPNYEIYSSIRFEKGEISSYRYGVNFYRGFFYYIGREYFLDIKSIDERIIKIRMKTFYGFHRKALNEKFNDILRAFFQTHHLDIIDHYLNILKTNTSVNIADTLVNAYGVFFDGHTTEWYDLGFKAYSHYSALYSKTNPKIYKSYPYSLCWNAMVLYGLAKYLSSHKLENY